MSFSIQRRVEFRDTDAAGIVHFSAFFPMMEVAEHEFLRSLGVSVFPRDEDSVTWPRVAAACDYQAAARFEDLLDIRLEVTKIGSSSVEYSFTFTRESKPIAKGKVTAVCCHHQSDGPGGGRLEKTPIPDELRQLLVKHQH
ncbi:MAG: acyl-CoA thioesterase [Rubripirellula sp.]